MTIEFEIPTADLMEIENHAADQNGKINKNGKIILIIIAAMCLLICICSVVCIATGMLGIGSVVMERKPVHDVLDEFMIDIARDDVEAAYDLFSPRAQRQTNFSDLERMSQGNDAVIFEGYQSLKVQNINISASLNTDQNQPQGSVATVSGVIYYDRGETGNFEAVLEKVDDHWMLFSIDLSVSPSEFRDMSG
ncbi:MAG: hypothetical protein JEZ00_08385 [Anaerolineaceae bacterium]|nr:hypothetical protein [Anaerolineaceae bacterium]